jgi:hypothetical protein
MPEVIRAFTAIDSRRVQPALAEVHHLFFEYTSRYGLYPRKPLIDRDHLGVTASP